MPKDAEHILIGLDVNATRLRAVAGPQNRAEMLPLDGDHAELPLALNLEGRSPTVGRPGLALCRRLPHLACVNFLPHLGDSRRWGAGRQSLQADKALALVLEHLRPACGPARALALALPAYLSCDQVGLVLDLAGKSRLPVVGSTPGPLAAALAAHGEQPWSGLALVVDVDDQALTCALVAAEEGWARLVEARCLPHLGLRAWKERLLNAVADRCVRQSRRDPRDSAAAEQTLHDQLEGVLEAGWHSRLVELAIETPHWFQSVVLRPEEPAGFCGPLVRQALEALIALRTTARCHGALGPVIVTAAAGRLPGLMAALEDRGNKPSGDFARRVGDDGPAPEAVQVLAAEASAWAVHDLAARICSGELEAGHLDTAPLPPPHPVDAGLPRLHFHGEDYVLHGRSFVLGHHANCDLVFDAQLYPTVAARHCEILREARGYLLRDRGAEGISVNERPVIQQLPLHPGDWIRLGPDGPVLRFLGRSAGVVVAPRSAVNG